MLFPEHLRFEAKNVGFWGIVAFRENFVPLLWPLEGKIFVPLELLLKGTAFVHSPMETSRENCILNGHYIIQQQGNYVCPLGIPTRRKNCLKPLHFEAEKNLFLQALRQEGKKLNFH